ncbi:hypothetical protein GHT09_017440 [Marmota monax]|uniref:Uncharacterized protein n=1 Tax=Marmota monax TaxID=9995 RepID=A0A834Q5H5_MARMO|nr:hypothetical protein GHT09_017440 [Marmota monax]
MESAAFFLQEPCGSLSIKILGRVQMNDFFRKEKIKATLIHPEKEKFPCSAETGDVDRHHPRRRPDGMPEAGGQMFVPFQGSLLDSSALSHVSTRARAHHRQAPRLLAQQQLGVWG